MNEKIDFVVTWVDGNEPNWQNEKKETLKKEGLDTSKIDLRVNRFRDMECLKYWFRGVEQYAPWVNKIYFVTCDQKPEWLNENNKKIVLVNHKDYIPEEYFPTFNSNAIEIMMHKIKGLSEEFVYFNDDMFLINKVNPSHFFKNGLPVDTMSFHPIEPKGNDKRFYLQLCNNMEIINKYYNFKKFVKNNILKCFSFKQGKHLPITAIFCGLTSFRGFYTYHLPIPYLKTTFEELWEKEEEVLSQTMTYRFRNNEKNVNHWIFQFWQFASGKFYQRSTSFGKYCEIVDKDIEKLILNSKIKTICINDSSDQCDFELEKKKLINIFEKKFPNKSTFEK